MIKLNKYIGGLGNQCFQVVSIYCYSKKKGINFSLPIDQIVSPGCVNSPCYQTTIFKPFYDLIVKKYAGDTNKPLIGPCVLPQFVNIMNFGLSGQDHILVDSLLMNKYNYQDYREELKEIFSKGSHIYDKEIGEILKRYEGKRIICISVRRFIQENAPQYAGSDIYYRKAIELLDNQGKLTKDTVLFVFGDDDKWIKEVFKKIHTLNDCNIEYFVGKRDGKTDVLHFYIMLECCNDFVLCNSTYHYWPAFLRGVSVIFDASYDFWFRDNIVPTINDKNGNQWIGLN